MDAFCKAIGVVIIFSVVVVVIGGLLALPTMFLVNGLFAPSAIQAVFGVEKIGFLCAFGLNILCGLLFKSSTSSSSS